MRTFKILIKFPKDEELIVAAYAAVAMYERKLRSLKVPFQTFIIAEESWLTELIIPPMTFISENIDDVFGTSFDMIVDMRDEDIISLGKSGKHAAYCCGVMLGLSEVHELVPVEEEINFDVCYIPWSEKSLEFGNDLLHKFDLKFTNLAPTYSKVVVGFRSIATYLAACAGRSVLELYSLEDYPREFLSKFSNPQYSMLCVQKKEDIENSYHIIYRALERKLNAINTITRAESV